MEPQTNLSPPFRRKTFRKGCSCFKFSFQLVKPAAAVAIAHLLLLHLIMIEFVTVNGLCRDNLFSCLSFQQVPDLKCSDPNADQICAGKCGGDSGSPPSPESLLPQVRIAHCCRLDGQCCCNTLYLDDGTFGLDDGDGDGRPPEDDAGNGKNGRLMDFSEQYFENGGDDDDDGNGSGGYMTVDHRVGG